MTSTEAEPEEGIPGLGLINEAKETAMNSCNSIKNSLGIWHIIRLLISPLTHAIDVGTDVNLAYRYYSDNEYLYAGLTSFFVVGPTILVSVLQKMYFQDFSPGSILKWIFQMVLMVLPISPFVSSFQALNHVSYLKRTVTDFAENPDLDKFDAFKSRYDTLVKEKSSASMVGVAEGFLQSAPQLVLQLTIILSRENPAGAGSVNLYLSLISSFASTMKAFVSFYNSVQKNKPTWIGTILLYLWSVFVITSRILAMSQGMTVHPVETSFICIIHWFGMTIWLSFLENTRYNTEPKEGKLGKLLGQIPLDKMKLETITNVGTQLKDGAVAKVGALANIFSSKEVKGLEEKVTESEVKEDDGKVETPGTTDPNGEEKAQAKELKEGEGEVKAPRPQNRITFKKVFFGAVFGLIYIFVYVSITEKPTRNKFAFYYFVWFLENCFFLIIGCQELLHDGAWFFLILRAATFGGVVASLVVMTIYTLFHQPLWPKKVNASDGGFGLENAYQYGLSSIKVIDPTQLVPLNSINPAHFIPSLGSLPTNIPGTELISNLIPGKDGNVLGGVPGAQIISGLFSGKEDDSTSAIPGAQLVSGLISGKEENSSSLPGAQIVSGLFSAKEDDSTSASAVPGAQLVSGLFSGKGESSAASVVPGGQLISGFSSGKQDGAGLISGLMLRKEENPSGNNTESVAEKGENLSCAIPGANLLSSFAPEKEGDSSTVIPEVLLTPGKVESVPSIIPGSQFVSGLISKDDENASDATPTQLISGLIPGNGESSFKLWGK